MNKKEEKWRIEGALYALRLAKEKGIDYLQEDIKRRGALGLSLQIPEKAAREAPSPARNLLRFSLAAMSPSPLVSRMEKT